MKKFTKLFLSCAAVTAVAAAISVSAMAADVDIKGTTLTGTFDDSTKAVTITKLGSGAETEVPDAGSEVTFLVYKKGSTDEVAAANVKGIDQVTTESAALKQPENNKLKEDVVAPNDGQDTYVVKVGYYVTADSTTTFKVATGEFKLGTASGSTQLLGDTNADGNIDVSDGSAILQQYVKLSTLTGDNLLAADANDDGNVDVGDGSLVLQYYVKLDSSLGTKTVGDKKYTEVK